PIQPMQYGSLNVTTNMDSKLDQHAVITVFDSNNILVGFGLTGKNGNHDFNALRTGDYTVTVSYYEQFKEVYDIQTQTASVIVGSTTTLDFDIDAPMDVLVTYLVRL
ncbi:MAG: carboxypeptidase-like regulatory domain-containing protein, partial [Halanaerobiales bacterium]